MPVSRDKIEGLHVVYEGWIGFMFIFVHKGILVITQGYIGDSQ